METLNPKAAEASIAHSEGSDGQYSLPEHLWHKFSLYEEAAAVLGDPKSDVGDILNACVILVETGLLPDELIEAIGKLVEKAEREDREGSEGGRSK